MPCREFVKDGAVVCSIKMSKTTSSCYPFVIAIYTCINGLHNHQAFAYKTGLAAYIAFKKYIAVLCKGVVLTTPGARLITATSRKE